MSLKISVIIPVFNDPCGLKNTVQSLIKQNYPKDKYEIIIVDNGSKDNTYKVAESFLKSHSNLIKVAVENKIQSSYAARNKGLKISKGRIMVFLDADMTVEPAYLNQIDNYFSQKLVDYLGSKVNIYSKKDTLSSKFNIVNGFPVKSYLENNHFVPTCCLSVKKSVVHKVGNFDNRLESSGDLEFGNRVYEAGFKQKYAENIVIHHPARWEYRSLINKHKRLARGFAQLNYYIPGKYRYLYNGFYRLRGYFPSKPIKLYKKYKNRQIPISWYSAIILSFLNLPLKIVSLFALINEEKKLRKLGKL